MVFVLKSKLWFLFVEALTIVNVTSTNMSSHTGPQFSDDCSKIQKRMMMSFFIAEGGETACNCTKICNRQNLSHVTK